MNNSGGLNAILSGGNVFTATNSDIVSGSALIFPCIDWIDMGGNCSMLCPHCHPPAGGKAAVPKKAYYAVYGNTATETYLTLLTPQDASSLAKAITSGAVRSGAHIQFTDGAINILGQVDNEDVSVSVDHQSVCEYMAAGKITFISPDTRFVFRCGPLFCGLGIINYHAGMVRTPIETRLMNANFSLSELRKLEDERELSG